MSKKEHVQYPILNLPPSIQLYEVIRGTRLDPDKFMRRLANLMFSQGEQELLTIARQIEHDGPSNYGGTFYTNCFRVNSRILLHGVTFLGPALHEIATYEIFVDLIEPKRKNVMPFVKGKRIMTSRQKITVNREQDFTVYFPKPICITPGVWYGVNFCLEGPDTCRCEKTETEATIETRIGRLTFQFTDGCKQMSKLHFSLS